MSYASILSIKDLMHMTRCDLQDAKWVMGKVADDFGWADPTIGELFLDFINYQRDRRRRKVIIRIDHQDDWERFVEEFGDDYE